MTLISIISVDQYTTVELKSDKKYAAVVGERKDFPFYLIIKCWIKLLMVNKKSRYERDFKEIHNKTREVHYESTQK